MKKIPKHKIISLVIAFIVGFIVYHQVAPSHGYAMAAIVTLAVDILVCAYADMIAQSIVKDTNNDTENKE